MQAIILAAGMGSRLGELTKNHTKSMVTVAGETMMERLLHQLDRKNLSKIIIVVGYEATELIDYINSLRIKTKIDFVNNEIYDETNNIYSLYLAKDYLQGDDTLLFESDLIIEDCILDLVINDNRSNLAVVDKFARWMDGTCVTISNNKIDKFIDKTTFDFNEQDTYYKTVNIYKFSKNFSKRLYVPYLEKHMKEFGVNEYYETALKQIVELGNNDLEPLVLSGQKWYEVDDIQDLDIAETIFTKSRSKKLDLMQSRFGGYWRYPNLIDFCYLVNPFYPSDKIIAEISANTDRLVRDYPSGLKVNNLLASKHFEIKEDYVVIGNGASELIKIVMEEAEGNLGVIIPTFEEYPNRSEHLEIIKYPAHEYGYYYNQDDLIDFYQSKNLDYLLLINPDNPSGNYIKKEGVLKLLDWSKQENIKFILDESFIDFIDEEENGTLLKNEILEKYPNLILIKSISKSYGVPGVRLGILATSDTDIIKMLTKSVSIWNINSFGEFYMQVVDKYKKDFANAMEKFRKVRNEYVADLKTISYLKVCNSQSNYIMCEVLPPYTSRELTEILLDEHEVFIKDLTPKQGFNREFIRVAVKRPEENEKLINALKKLEGN